MGDEGSEIAAPRLVLFLERRSSSCRYNQRLTDSIHKKFDFRRPAGGAFRYGGGDADGGSLAVSCDVSSSNTGVNACGAWVGEGKSLEWLERDRSENGGSGHEGADAEGTPRGEAQACGDVGNAKTL